MDALMLPEYSLSRLDVVHCCPAEVLLNALADASVDIVVTSPPYNLSWHKSVNSGLFHQNKWLSDFWDGYDTYADNRPESEYQIWLRAVVKECLRVAKGLVWINHKTRYRDGIGIHPLSFLPFPLWSEVVWNRGGSMTLNSRRFAPSHEYFFGFGKPEYWNDNLNTAMSVWRINPENGNSHPAPFPEVLISPLIEASCPPGGIVLDPFMGSGTTALAAKKMNRHFIGCDVSRAYVDLAHQRLAHGWTLPMFKTAGD